VNDCCMTRVCVPNAGRLVVRWTVGDVRPRGFEALRLSIACAQKLFGPDAKYVVCVNTVSVMEAKRRTGAVSGEVEWREVTAMDAPNVLLRNSDSELMGGMGWKLIPLRVVPSRYELALDNDCILWKLPSAMRQWLESDRACLLAEDVDRFLGSFDALCPPGAMNAGVRGLPPGEDLREPLRHVINEVTKRSSAGFRLTDEIEEQGLQAAAVCHLRSPLLVSKEEVSICSPFWPRSPELGTCGAHFVGINAAHIPWEYYEIPADEWLNEHWNRHRPELYAKAELPLPS